MTRRVKYIDVSAQIIAEICKMAASHALPQDAQVVRLALDPVMNNFKLVVESKEFEEIAEGGEIPKHADPVVSTTFLDMLRGKDEKVRNVQG